MDDHLYFYGCDDISDWGWGCVYRCIQSFQSRRGHPVLTLPSMMQVLGVRFRRDNPRSMWIEPKDGKILIPERTELAIFGEDADLATNRMMRTSWENADIMLHKVSDWLQYVHEALERGPIILDNGVCSYLLLRREGDGYVIMDPHTPSGVIKRKPQIWLTHSQLWMALGVRKN